MSATATTGMAVAPVRRPVFTVGPDFTAVTGTGLGDILGALLTITLITAVAALIVSALIWALAAAAGNPSTAAKARGGVLVALAGAALTGAAVAWVNWLIATGNTL